MTHPWRVDDLASFQPPARKLRCACQWEAGDSPCPVHGDTECPECGAVYVGAAGHPCQRVGVAEEASRG